MNLEATVFRYLLHNLNDVGLKSSEIWQQWRLSTTCSTLKSRFYFVILTKRYDLHIPVFFRTFPEKNNVFYQFYLSK